ncbi:MAG: epimerase [Pseudomonadota bacterium]
MTQSALILGAKGRFGSMMATVLERRGWQIQRFDRSSDVLKSAAKGADVIVYGWNPTYDRWASDVPGQVAQVIDSVRRSGATVLIPGNVYVYGADAPEVFADETRHLATNPLGQIRIQMESAFRDAGVKTIVLRGGDFLDTRASGNWFDQVIAAKLGMGKIAYPGDLDTPHSWAYLPDLTRAMADLAKMRDTLPVFTSINFPGFTLTGREMADHLQVAPSKMPWLPIYLACPFWPLAKHLLEMRYLWNKPHRLESAAFHRLLPDFEFTPVAQALTQAASFQIDPDQVVIRRAVAAIAE